MSLFGNLFLYDQNRRLVAFKSGDMPSKTALVAIGGLTDGLLSLPYIVSLSEACSKANISLFQPLLRSSYNGFGHCSLDTDSEDLSAFLDHLEHAGYENVHLLGHSTGCQDILWLLRQRSWPFIKKVILQGPVSDADFIQSAHGDLILKYEEHCKLYKVDEDCNLPFTLFGAPISAYRFRSLAYHGGDDDMFSCEQSNVNDFLPKDIPLLVVMSGNDQYVPGHVDPEHLLYKFNSCQRLFLPNADHFINDSDSEQKFITTVIEFIQCGN